jgi:hypothetical protein
MDYVGIAALYGTLGTLRVLPGNEAFAKQKVAALQALRSMTLWGKRTCSLQMPFSTLIGIGREHNSLISEQLN